METYAERTDNVGSRRSHILLLPTIPGINSWKYFKNILQRRKCVFKLLVLFSTIQNQLTRSTMRMLSREK